MPLEEEHRAPADQINRAAGFWDDFFKAIESEAEVPIAEIPGMLDRLTRTGLYRFITANLFGYGGDKGCLTPNFATFLKALDITQSNVAKSEGIYYPGHQRM